MRSSTRAFSTRLATWLGVCAMVGLLTVQVGCKKNAPEDIFTPEETTETLVFVKTLDREPQFGKTVPNYVIESQTHYHFRGVGGESGLR